MNLKPLRLVFSVPLILLSLPVGSQSRLPLDTIKLPPGFSITVYADNVPNARSMTLGARGTVFVGSMAAGKVYAVVDKDGDQRGDEIHTIAQGLNHPNGTAFKDGSLYVAEINRILRFDKIEENLADPPQPVVVNDSLPDDFHHGWKFIAFGPDGLLYIPVGAPCNVCEPDPNKYAVIKRMRPDGKDLEVFARGVRNTVGLAWHPQTGELWFTDNGRDWLGDDQPPDELNRAPRQGMHFGYPYCHGGDIIDPKYGAKHKCDEFTPPAQKLAPHVAALGLRFYTGSMFPAEYRNRVIIAEHGSWNRSQRIGYRLTMATVTDTQATDYQIFASGWLQGELAWGRPVDVLVMPDGALLVSDDRAGALYRISFGKR
jgi:glucose/arabinose dehydrogenase